MRPTEAERQVPIRRAADVEAIGLRELLLVPVPRRVPDRDLVADTNPPAVQLDVRLRLAGLPHLSNAASNDRLRQSDVGVRA